jgi:hypothetical protein
MCKSEIAQLRRQIEMEVEAMHRGMSGIALGSARHDFINARMQRISACQESLATYVGDTSAHHIVCQVYMQTMETDTTFDTHA